MASKLSKVELFAVINEVHYQTMNGKSIRSALRKTGNWNYMPQVVLDQIRELRPEELEEETIFATPFGTPTSQLFHRLFKHQIVRGLLLLGGFIELPPAKKCFRKSLNRNYTSLMTSGSGLEPAPLL